MPVAKALWLLDDCAKNMRSNRAHSGNALKLAYLPKGCANSFDFFEGLLPLQKRVIKLSVEPAHHSPFLFGRQLLEILLAPFSRKHFDPVQAQHTPATIACFDQRPEPPAAHRASSRAHKPGRGKSHGCDLVPSTLL